MVLLKEDGSLDIERINRLPREDYIREMGMLTEEQVEEYMSKLPMFETHEPINVIESKFTLEERLERGEILVDDLLSEIRKDLRLDE